MSMDDTSGNELAKETFQIISAGKDQLVGVVAGQRLRMNVANPEAAEQKFKPLFAFVVEDLDGRLLADSGEISVEPGHAHSFDVRYADLAATGRVQVHATFKRFYNGIVNRVGQGAVDPAPDSLELIDEATGRTVLLISRKTRSIAIVG
jgi:hypothetical protein